MSYVHCVSCIVHVIVIQSDYCDTLVQIQKVDSAAAGSSLDRTTSQVSAVANPGIVAGLLISSLALLLAAVAG